MKVLVYLLWCINCGASILDAVCPSSPTNVCRSTLDISERVEKHGRMTPLRWPVYNDDGETASPQTSNAHPKNPMRTHSPFWGLLSAMTLATSSAAKVTINDKIAALEASNSPLLQYPTQFTQGIMPKQIHSHNDYWRDVPLLTALSFGVQSVEADVWLINGTLFVGHERAALTPNRTLDSLYVQPLLEILDAQNPKNEFTEGITSVNGVFDTTSDASLQFLIDIKTDGVEALPFILKALDPLRQKGYLTTFENGILTASAVTVVGTGNSPLEQVKALSPRDYFFDAPLTDLTNTTLNTTWDPTLSPLASTDYKVAVGWNGIGQISDAQLANVTKFVKDAHDRGIKARFWDTPAWPIRARNNIWSVLLDNGADWLNADDLEAASKF